MFSYVVNCICCTSLRLLPNLIFCCICKGILGFIKWLILIAASGRMLSWRTFDISAFAFIYLFFFSSSCASQGVKLLTRHLKIHWLICRIINCLNMIKFLVIFFFYNISHISGVIISSRFIRWLIWFITSMWTDLGPNCLNVFKSHISILELIECIYNIIWVISLSIVFTFSAWFIRHSCSSCGTWTSIFTRFILFFETNFYRFWCTKSIPRFINFGDLYERQSNSCLFSKKCRKETKIILRNINAPSFG